MTETIDTEINTEREPRSAESRETQTRRKPWQPPSSLDAPKAPAGFKYRWIRESILNQEDKSNMSKRIREGFEPVRAEDHPDFEAPTVEDGKHAGVIGVGGLILAKIPEEIIAERKAYYKEVNDATMEAVDSQLMRESNPIMPIDKPQRSSRTTFGSRKNEETSS